jgi:hypothetical protein
VSSGTTSFRLSDAWAVPTADDGAGSSPAAAMPSPATGDESVEPGRLTMLSDQEGYETLARTAVESHFLHTAE